jgi:hypothetical protein
VSLTNVELHKLSLSAEKLADLSSQERYVFALAGHVFNETMMLQKMVITARPPADAHPFIKDAAVGSGLFVLRILVGKTEEAMSTLCKESVQEVLRQQILSRADGLNDKWTEVIGKYRSLPWLGKIRNQRSFHYMNAAQWSPHLVGDICTGGYVIVGPTYGATLFHWQEMAAGLPMMKLVNDDSPFDGLALMLDELGVLLGDLGDCLAIGLQKYMLEVVTESDGLGEAQVIAVPKLDDTHLHYFMGKS